PFHSQAARPCREKSAETRENVPLAAWTAAQPWTRPERANFSHNTQHVWKSSTELSRDWQAGYRSPTSLNENPVCSVCFVGAAGLAADVARGGAAGRRPEGSTQVSARRRARRPEHVSTSKRVPTRTGGRRTPGDRPHRAGVRRGRAPVRRRDE